MELVSVIVPTYRRPQAVVRAVESVSRQTYRQLEIVIVDDNGADTADQFATRAALAPAIGAGRVRYIVHETNAGANAARNTGIRHASGSFLALLDDDDEWVPEKIAKQVPVMSADERIGVVYGRTLIRYDDLGIQYSTRPSLSGNIHPQQLIENYVGAMSTVLIRRAAVIDQPFDENLPARHDYDLWIRLSAAWHFELVDDVLVIMHASQSRSRISGDLRRYLMAIEMINDKYAAEIARLPPAAKRMRDAEQLYFLGSQAIKANLPRTARQYFFRSLRRRFSLKAAAACVASFGGVRGTLHMRALQSQYRASGTRTSLRYVPNASSRSTGA